MNCIKCASILPIGRKPNKSGLCKKCYNKKYREVKAEKVAALNKKWYLLNKNKRIEQGRLNKLKRYSLDPEYKICCRLRIRLNQAINGNFKAGSAVKDLGCSIEEFKKYIETLWQPGMSWDNWSKHGWHIDHVVPLASFDLTDKDQLVKACNYKNLQPLWAKDNWSKGGRSE